MASTTERRLTPFVHPIRNGREFDIAVARLDVLMDADPEEGSAAHDHMELLTILIAAYEEKNLPSFMAASPQEVVRFMAEQKGLDSAELAGLLGGRSRLSEFYNGVRALSRNQIIRLKAALGIPADLLLAP